MNAALCVARGYHVVLGHATGTSVGSTVWSDYCSVCGCPAVARTSPAPDVGFVESSELPGDVSSAADVGLLAAGSLPCPCARRSPSHSAKEAR